MTHFEEEIRAQPDILDALLADRAAEETAVALAHRDFRLILSLARGSSDNAVTFFTYLAGRYLGLPVASVPPSLLSVYTSSMQAQDTLCIGVSQSGESSDVLEGLRALAAAGATTIALTNRQESSLAQAAEFPLCTHAGEEQAVAASKTFSSQMMLLARLVASWSGNETLQDALAAVPAAMRELLAAPEAIMHLALRLTHAEGLYVLGRGLSYGPALELALKLKETSYLHAQAYSSAEFQHGPIAAIDTAEPVLLLGLADATLDSNLQAARRLAELGADLSIISSAPALLDLASTRVPLPANLPAVTEAFLGVLAGQLLALQLTQSRGLDPDKPRHLSKVTKTM